MTALVKLKTRFKYSQNWGIKFNSAKVFINSIVLTVQAKDKIRRSCNSCSIAWMVPVHKFYQVSACTSLSHFYLCFQTKTLKTIQNTLLYCELQLCLKLHLCINLYVRWGRTGRPLLLAFIRVKLGENKIGKWFINSLKHKMTPKFT